MKPISTNEAFSASNLRNTGSQPDQIIKDIYEVNFLLTFTRQINREFSVSKVLQVAAVLLHEYLNLSAVMFNICPTSGSREDIQYVAVSDDRNRAFAKILAKDIFGQCNCEINLFENKESLFQMQEDILSSESIYLNLPGSSGEIVFFRRIVENKNASDIFYDEICNSLSGAVTNALQYTSVKDLSMRDSLTGLFNRRVFVEMLEIENARRDAAPVSMVMVDLDDFKSINDTFGHQYGDQVLAEFGSFLKNNCRGADLVARYGGEEFAVMLRAYTVKDASDFAHRLLNNLKSIIFLASEIRLTLTVSIGLAHTDGNRNCDLHKLLYQADSALYKAKFNGKNQVCIADEEYIYTAAKSSGRSHLRLISSKK